MLNGLQPCPRDGVRLQWNRCPRARPHTCPGPSDADLWHSLLRGVCCPHSSIQLPAWLPISAEDI